MLGSILLLPIVCDDVALIVRPEDFYDDANRTLYAHLREMHDDGPADRHHAAGRAAEKRRPVRGDRRRRLPGRNPAIGAHGGQRHALRRDRQEQSHAAGADPSQHRDSARRLRRNRRSPRNAGPRRSRRSSRSSTNAAPASCRTSATSCKRPWSRIDARMKHEHTIGGIETGFRDFDTLDRRPARLGAGRSWRRGPAWAKRRWR